MAAPKQGFGVGAAADVRMNNHHRALLAGVVAFALLGAAPAAAPKPVRHLVYNFDFTTSSDLNVKDSGIGGGPVSGSSDYRGSNGDKGQITADVMHVQPDMGLIVDISEQARDTRSAEPAECVVYGNTNVICDPNKKVTEEEFALLRFLGRNFIDSSQLDAKRHWKIQHTDPRIDVATDFTITNDDNGIMSITESRVLKQLGAQGFESTTDGKITYNLALTVPDEITEDTMQRQDRGMGQYNTQHTQVHLKLATDSLANAASTP